MSSQKTRILYCFLTFYVSFSNQQEVQVSDHSERELIKYLTIRRPWFYNLVGIDRTIPVQIDLLTIHNAFLDTSEELLTLNGYLKMNWTNPNWKWDPAEFSGLKKTVLPETYTWRPKISLLNSNDQQEFQEISSVGPSTVLVTNDGEINWRPFVQLHVKCPLNLRNFPFDQHDCPAIFSTTVFQNDLKISLNQKHESDSKQNRPIGQPADEVGEWKVKNLAPTTVDNKIYFHYRFSRRSSYLFIAIFVPLLASTVAAASMFWLSHSVSKKMTVGSVGILIQIVLLMHLIWLAPPSSKSIPTIVLLGCFQLVLSLTCLILSGMLVHIISRHHPSTHLTEFSSCLKGPCGKVLCLGISKKQTNMAAHFDSFQDRVILETKEENITIKSVDCNQENLLLICTALDRIFFIFYVLSYLTIMILLFI